jgi:short-subunit dehydrogenase
MTADEVARIGLDAMFAGKPVVIAGMLNRVAAFGTRFAPRALATKMARMVQERV